VTRGVDDVDLHALVADRGVLRENGDALLALEVVGVHHPFGDVLVATEGARLPQQVIDERGLAMVNVSDDGDVTDVFARNHTDRTVMKVGERPKRPGLPNPTGTRKAGAYMPRVRLLQ